MARRPSTARGDTLAFSAEPENSADVGIIDDLIDFRPVINGQKINEEVTNRALLDLITKNLGDASLVHRVRNMTDTEFVGDVLTLGWLGHGTESVLTDNLNNIIDRSGHWRWGTSTPNAPTT